MHAAPDDGCTGPHGAHTPCELEPVADLRPAHRGDTDEDGLADHEGPVVVQAQVGDARAVAGAAQR